MRTSSAFEETEDEDDDGNDCEKESRPDQLAAMVWASFPDHSSAPIVLELELVLDRVTVSSQIFTRSPRGVLLTSLKTPRADEYNFSYEIFTRARPVGCS
jgi:hypothetical protein